MGSNPTPSANIQGQRRQPCSSLQRSRETLITAYSCVNYFLIVALMMALVSLPIFKAADSPPGSPKARLVALDGLRGILASSVLVHHAASNYRFIRDGKWDLPPSGFYTVAGEGAVDMFFMITGYLFWSRLIAEQGRPRWMRLYLGRFFRIAPVYFAVIAGVFLSVLSFAGFTLKIGRLALLEETVEWLSLGVTTPGDFNGDTAIGPRMGMAWTLHSEWIFYFTLPTVAFVAGSTKWHLTATSSCLAAGLVLVLLTQNGDHTDFVVATLFLMGMMAASLQAKDVRLRLSPTACSAASVLLLAGAGFGCANGYDFPAVLMLGLVFHLVVSGSTIFGLLTSKPSRRLGDISYGIYLVQGLVFYDVLGIRRVRVFARQSDASYWLVMGLCATATVSLAWAIHLLVENPGVRLGRYVSNRRDTAAL